MSEVLITTETQSQGVSKFYYSSAGFNILLEPGVKTEIIEKRDIFPIPHTPQWCQGMISLRGKLIPVVNLQKLLNDAESGKSQWLLVLEIAPYPQLAIRIDQLPMQQQINNEQHEAVSHGKLPTWIESKVSIDGKLLYQANHSQLFEQLIQENEKLRGDMQEPQTTSNQDSSGNNA